MQRAISLVLTLSLLLVSSSAYAIKDRGDFKIKYRKASGELSDLAQALKEEQVFDELILSLNDSLKLPVNVPVVFTECDEINAFYDPESGEIQMCYELIANTLDTFLADQDLTEDEATEYAFNTVVFVLFHEIGHALVDIYDLPITGKEEDAVDDLAAIISAQAGEEGQVVILSAVTHFGAQAELLDESGEELAFWDEHSLDHQRMYSLACLLYGSDPETFEDLVGDDGLPEERAERCPYEYEQKSRAWERILDPYFKD